MKRGKYATDNPYRATKLCFIPSLKLSCFGCCGQDYTTKKEILARIKRNTKELEASEDMISFRDRAQETAACGICTNVVFLEKDKKIVGCPLHPSLNEGKDLREGYCQIDHLCKAAEKFMHWDDEMKQKFLDFIALKAEKGMGWYEYSIGMDDDTLLKEFKDQ